MDGGEDVEVKTPGQVLRDDFLEPSGISRYRLSQVTGIAQSTLDRIITRGGSIIPINCLLLSRFFGMSEKYWINLQVDYTVRVLKGRCKGQLDKVIKH